MAVSDPIADMLTRIRNACQARHPEVSMPSSRLKAALADVFKQAGYIQDFSVEGEVRKTLTIQLKYQGKTPVIEGIKRISTPACRRYVPSDEIPHILGGLGTAVLSTSHGLMTGQRARKEKVGGELLC